MRRVGSPSLAARARAAPPAARARDGNRQRWLVALAMIAGAVVLAACGSSTTSSQPAGTEVATTGSQYGTILVDASGHTLYAFSSDSPTSSRCTGACNQTWIPLTTQGKPRAGSGADASLLATLTVPDGRQQVSYAGHPLYSFVGDTAPGQTGGQGVAGAWHVVSASGQVITTGSPAATSTSRPSGATATTVHPTTTTHPTTSTSAPTTTSTSTTTTSTTRPSGY